MAAVKIDRLFELLCKDAVSVTLSDGKGKAIRIDPVLYIKLPEYELKQQGFTVKVGGNEQSADDFDGLKKFLSEACAGKDESDGEDIYEVIEISDRYRSIEEYERQKSFETISMRELLARYPNADEFEMTLPQNSEEITDEQAERAIAELRKHYYDESRRVYESLSNAEKAELPDFETLYGEIDSECVAFRKKHAKKVEKYNGNAFFCDRFGSGNTRYKEPQKLWHLYSAVDNLHAAIYALDRTGRVESPAPNDELDGIPPLKKALMGVKLTYSWHCTTSGNMVRLCRFKLTDGAKEWLLTRKDDYDLDIFEDLALYAGRKILFSSCTHEHFHNDCEEN